MELPHDRQPRGMAAGQRGAAGQGEAGDAGARRARRRAPAPADDGVLGRTTSSRGPTGSCTFADLFEGRRQLILYHFWFPPDGEPCGGCSMFTDQVGRPRAPQRARRHVRPRLARAAGRRSRRSSERMGWDDPLVHGGRRRSSRGAAGRPSTSRSTSSCATATASSSPTRRSGARRRGAGQRLDLPRPHAARPPGGVGGHPARPPAVAAVPVVAPARQLRLAPTRPRGSR